MEDNYEKTLELLKQKFPAYDENKEEFRKNDVRSYELIEYYEMKVEEKKNKSS